MRKFGLAVTAFLVFSGSGAQAEEDRLAQVLPAPIVPAIQIGPLVPRPELEVPPIMESAPAQPELEPVPELPAVDLDSDWGFGARENAYNEKILRAVEMSWSDASHPLPPRLFKALIAQESAFKPAARSWAGAVGLTQLMPEAAQRLGLRLSDRTNPDLALPAGVSVLEEKYRVLMDPLNYWSYLGQPGRMEEWNVKAAEAYQVWGEPEGNDRWFLTLAAYNGGGSTILRAVAKAHDRKLDPRKWSNLVGPTGRPKNSPLYAACVEVYKGGAWGKYQEIAHYPVKIFAYYQR